jgi:cob(I)alamin adenosyltransferase
MFMVVFFFLHTQGGGKASSSLHVARTVCRRAERAIVPIVREQQINPETLKYVNR